MPKLNRALSGSIKLSFLSQLARASLGPRQLSPLGSYQAKLARSLSNLVKTCGLYRKIWNSLLSSWVQIPVDEMSSSGETRISHDYVQMSINEEGERCNVNRKTCTWSSYVVHRHQNAPVDVNRERARVEWSAINWVSGKEIVLQHLPLLLVPLPVNATFGTNSFLDLSIFRSSEDECCENQERRIEKREIALRLEKLSHPATHFTYLQAEWRQFSPSCSMTPFLCLLWFVLYVGTSGIRGISDEKNE